MIADCDEEVIIQNTYLFKNLANMFHIKLNLKYLFGVNIQNITPSFKFLLLIKEIVLTKNMRSINNIQKQLLESRDCEMQDFPIKLRSE